VTSSVPGEEINFGAWALGSLTWTGEKTKGKRKGKRGGNVSVCTTEVEDPMPSKGKGKMQKRHHKGGKLNMLRDRKLTDSTMSSESTLERSRLDIYTVEGSIPVLRRTQKMHRMGKLDPDGKGSKQRYGRHKKKRNGKGMSRVKGGKGKKVYTAYSPLAIRLGEISFPETVTGTGVTGTVSFDNTFGYTGAYSPDIIGPYPAFAFSNFIDIGSGFARQTVFTLSNPNRPFVRFSLTDASTSDGDDLLLQVFRLDEEENRFRPLAQSNTPGTSNEEVILRSSGTNFITGVFLVRVAGTGRVPRTDYTLFMHLFSIFEPTNNMRISASEQVVAGATFTNELQWTATEPPYNADTIYFGGVAHYRGDKYFGTTIVKIDA
jgi:hypothetical protein